MTILDLAPALVNSEHSNWNSWADERPWELGPDRDDGTPVMPYTPDDDRWWAEQTRDGDRATDEGCENDPAYHAHLDQLADECEAADRLARGICC